MTTAVVVVTYNRLKDLKICIEALKNQSLVPDEILIINNSSTDGTGEYLATVEGITVVEQPNEGGAGGFARGLQEGYGRGHEWTWLMDDDCIPAKHSFESLMGVVAAIGDRYPVINSRAIKDNAASRPDADATPASAAYRMTGPSLFNGTLVRRQVMETVGNVRKELILWGDEINFFMRVRNRYGAVPVAVDSIILHPAPSSMQNTPAWKQYFSIRNSVYNAFRHSRFGPIGVLFPMWQGAKRVTSGSVPLGLTLRATLAGLTGKLGWDNPYRK
ncbi:glycosyltransferase [Xanthobacter aminoxidans]|uniref:glycosyltransferase n=1 Tax=Xanthobacter aminoxidans TaxID=186280 RepID=UPI00372984AE